MSEPEKEQEKIRRDLERIRSEVRERALLEHEPLPPPRSTRPEKPSEPAPRPAAPPPPRRPDATAVNELWRAEPGAGTGLAGALRRFLLRVLAPAREAQVAFNSRQVQLDNQILEYVDARLDATHRHYDAVLGVHGRHMEEADERHLILQEELVAHVHDLVKRIDLVLSEAERGRLSLEVSLRDVRGRLVELERRLPRG